MLMKSAGGEARIAEMPPFAARMGEAICLPKRSGCFVRHANNPITSGLSIVGFQQAGHFEKTGAEARGQLRGTATPVAGNAGHQRNGARQEAPGSPLTDAAIRIFLKIRTMGAPFIATVSG